METGEPKRHRLRFSLRVLMIAVLVAGVWIGASVNNARVQREAVAAVKAYGGQVTYDWEMARPPLTEPPAPKWLRRLAGDECFQSIVGIILVAKCDPFGIQEPESLSQNNIILKRVGKVDALRLLEIKDLEVTDEGLECLRHLSGLQTLSIGNAMKISEKGVIHLESLTELVEVRLMESKLNDRSLASFAKLPKLKLLSLGGNQFTDAGLALLRGSTGLKHLSVGDRKRRITDAGLAQLMNLKNLQSLSLRNTEVTDAGLERLIGLTQLRMVDVGQTSVTEEGKASLQAVMPKLKVIR